MAAAWPKELRSIAWVDRGEIVIGGMTEYLPFRGRAGEFGRIDYLLLQDALDKGISGALTASGTMEVCRRMGLPLAVSCGIGGIGEIKGEELCPDLPALAELPVALIATSPKDMLDIPATIGWLTKHGVTVWGRGEALCTGYLFSSARVELTGCIPAGQERPLRPQELLLRPIPAAERIENIGHLPLGVAAGKAAEAAGRYYHPAANAEFDRLSYGQAAHIQLASIIANALLARQLV